MNEFFANPPLLADAGVPMLALTFPAMMVLVVPIIVIEGFLCKKWLGLTTWEAMKSNAVANLISTILGIPFAWGIMLGLEFGAMGLMSMNPKIQNSHSPILYLVLFLLSSAWIGPPGGAVWAVPCAVLVSLVPFFLASYGFEYLIINHMLRQPDGDPSNRTSHRIRIAVRNANLITYGILFLATSVWLVVALLQHWIV